MAAKASLTTSINNMLEMFNKKVDETIKDNNLLTDLLGQAETKTGLKKANIVAAIIAVLSIYLMVGYGSDFLCNFIGFAYPAYKSIKAIETKEKGDDTKWLIYWVVYSIFILLEYFANYLLSWIRFYWFFKCLFLIFCMCPEPFNGSLIIYKNIIRPFFLKHEATIDRGVRHLSTLGSELADEAFSVAQEALNREVNIAGSDFVQEKPEDDVIEDM